MPETKLIPTSTELTVSGTMIEITSRYGQDTLPDTIKAAIASSPGVQDAVSYQEGELIIEVKNYLTHIVYLLNLDGDLILQLNTGDGSSYSINSNGHLVYTTH